MANSVPAAALEAPLFGPSDEVPAGKDILELSLESLLQTEVQVTSVKPRRLRHAPGVVSVISREEIVLSGARDLIDVLHLVPGFYFAADVEGTVGTGLRGMYAAEGKMRLLWDGVELNDNAYGWFYVGNHFPVDHIQRIEVIRGPGSVVHGGFAELAVINVVTRGPNELKNGFSVGGKYGWLKNTFGRRTLSIEQAHRIGDDLSLSTGVYLGETNRSGATAGDFYGNTYTMANGNSRMDPTFVNLKLKWRDLDLRLIYDDYTITQRDNLYVASPRAFVTHFPFVSAQASYRFAVSDVLTLTPRLNYKYNRPYSVTDILSYHALGRPEGDDSEGYFTNYENSGQRFLGSVVAEATVHEQVELVLGLEGYVDRASLPRRSLYPTFLPFPCINDQTGVPMECFTENGYGPNTDELSARYENGAAFGEILIDLDAAQLSGGARFEYHSLYGRSFVPRLAATSLFGDFHVKAQAARAFRAPAVENIHWAYDPEQLKPETTTTLEAEVGYTPSNNVFVTANAFYSRVDDPLLYYADEQEEEGYRNLERVDTWGAEVELHVRERWGFGTLTYSFYQRAKNQVDYISAYNTDGSLNRSRLLGFPQHKITLNSGVRLWRGLHVSPSAVYLSERSAYARVDEDGNQLPGELPAVVLANVLVSYEDLGIDGLDVGAGVYNVLGESFLYPASNALNYHAPVPGLSRELLLRATYSATF